MHNDWTLDFDLTIFSSAPNAWHTLVSTVAGVIIPMVFLSLNLVIELGMGIERGRDDL